MFIEQALAELKHLDAESQHLRDQLAKNDERTSRLRIFVDVGQEFVDAGSKQGADGPATTPTSTSDASDSRTLTRRITDAVVDLIRAKGRPIRTRDLLAQIEQRGLDVGGKNPVATLSSCLSRDKKRLVNNRKLGWRLVEWGGDRPPR